MDIFKLYGWLAASVKTHPVKVGRLADLGYRIAPQLAVLAHLRSGVARR
ncbi:MAG: hypothetical protein P1P84_11940 [Deferrisomatales bacterium]|nr:hypothetical protein [Deferrisomatales bacterium]